MSITLKKTQIKRKKCQHKNAVILVIDAFAEFEETCIYCNECKQIIHDNMEDLQSNLKYFLTDEVENGQRKYKIVDGTKPLKEAHVFFEGTVKDLGNSESAFEDMGKAALRGYCDWYAKNRRKVKAFYTKVDAEEIKG